MKKINKIMNFRPVVVCAVSIIIAILLATFVFVTQNLRLSFLILLCFSLICLVICLVIFKTKVLTLIVLCLFMSTIVVGQIYHKCDQFEKYEKFDEMNFVIDGRICSNYSFTSSGNFGFYLDDVTICGADFESDINGKIVIYANPDNYDLSDFEVGRRVVLFGKINVNKLNDESKYSLSNLSNNIVMSCFVNNSKIAVGETSNKKFNERVRGFVYEKLKSYDLNYADVGYAMLFGDSSFLNENIETSFRTTGIAHLLAVSGLHISIIVLIISHILKLFKTSNKVNFVITFILVGFYAYLCDFSVSVLRAGIMTLLLLYLKARGKCYDKLTSLALAACIILMISPLKLFNVSFVLSFMAVLSIILLSKVFENLFEKSFYSKLAQNISLLIAVQFGLVFIQLYFFKNYSALSILINFVAVPIATFAFICLIVGFVISLIFPFMSFVCEIYDYFMGVVVKFNYTISKLGISFAINNLSFSVVVLGVCMFFMLSNYIFMKRRYKFATLSALMVFSLIAIFV